MGKTIKPISEAHMDAYQANADIRSFASDLEDEINLLCKPGRETTNAITKLEECLMWVTKSLTANGVNYEDGRYEHADGSEEIPGELG